MAAPAFVQAGAGVAITGTSGTVDVTGATAGNFLILQVLENGAASFPSLSSVTNIEELDGTDASMYDSLGSSWITHSLPATLQYIWIGRAITSATCSVIVNVAANDLICRLYEFSGVNTGTAISDVVEEGTSGGAGAFNFGSATSTSIADEAVQTLGNDRLALQLVAVETNQTLAAFAGETGGDWTEAVAEYGSGTIGTLGLQVASIPSATTIDGGTITISSAGWGVLGFALIPAAGPGPTLRVMRSNLRW